MRYNDSMHFHFPVFPFTAIVGQEDLKLALLLNAVNPAIGGVLIRGEKGTGKSTAVRALAGLLPDMEVVAGCLYGCHPKGMDGLCEDCQKRKVADNGLPVARGRCRWLPCLWGPPKTGCWVCWIWKRPCMKAAGVLSPGTPGPGPPGHPLH